MASNTLIHVINSLGRGGAEVQLCNTIKLLPEYEHVLVTLAPAADLLPDIKSRLSAHYTLNALGVSRWPLSILKLQRIIQKHRPLLVHTHLQIAGLLARFACPKKTPLFYTIHSPYSIDAFEMNRLALPMEKLAAQPYHHLIGVSDAALQDYRHYVPGSGSGDILYNLVADEFFQAASGKAFSYRPGETLRCVSVGSLKRAKNYRYSLDAFRLLEDLPITLDIYGEGPDEAMLRRYISNERLQNVRLAGRSENVSELLPQYDLYIISSSYEGFGIAPLEAMAVGLPVLASGIPVLKEVSAGAALYFDLKDARSLANLLREVVSGQRDLRALAQAGTARAAAVAHSQAYKEALVQVYQKYT